MRSRVASTPNSKKNSGVDLSEKEALNARLSDRRRQRREQRLQTNQSNNIDSRRRRRNRNQLLSSSSSSSSAYQAKKLIYGLFFCILVGVWILGFLYMAQRPTPPLNIKTSTTAGTTTKNFIQNLWQKAAAQRREGEEGEGGGENDNKFDPKENQPPSRLRSNANANANANANINANANANNNVNKNALAGFNIHAKEEEVIDMREMNAQLPFANPDGGAWKQGWDVQPVALNANANANKEPLKIFVVPHSHCDPGWIKTFDDYFQSQTKHILTSVMQALAKHPKRKFIWAEISYFEWWWKEQDAAMQDLVRTLLKNKQFEFVTGGWVQPDEANTQLYAMEIQLQEGHDFIRETFGGGGDGNDDDDDDDDDTYIPKFGWSIDPFGYSPTMAYLLKKYNFTAMLIQRVHYAIKKELALHQQLEFFWRQTWDDSGDYDIFTHIMPFYSYDVPHTCGPDPSVCCQFDFARIKNTGRGRGPNLQRCPWRSQPQPIHDHNVEERAMLLLDQYRKKAALYRSNVVIAPLGDDFRYQTLGEADVQFESYQRIFDYINANVPGVEIQFGTLSDYFNTVMRRTFDVPILKGSFFTYSDRDEDYWSGYFTSRIFDKALDRQLERVLYAATSMGATKLELQGPRRALSLFQHHDGVTGTAKPHVVADYAARIHKAIGDCQQWIIDHILIFEKGVQRNINIDNNNNNNPSLQACHRSNAPRGLSQNLCGEHEKVLVYNPLETEQLCGNVVVPGRSKATATLPCELPGALPNSRVDIRFDPVTGLMTHPIKEEWMVWRVTQGGAYLFFPGELRSYPEKGLQIEEGGFVVKTHNWKRTVVEQTYPADEFGTTATVIDFVYETNLQENNAEWLVRFSAGDADHISNQGVFHTDLNGYNFDTHHFRSDLPIQSQVFPMPTHASIEDGKQRLTILSEHAQGTASLEEGSIDIWLDRRLIQDDNRGLGEGVTDNVPTRTRLRVLVERDGFNHNNPEFEITPLCKRMWKELNHPLELFGPMDDAMASQIMASEKAKLDTDGNKVSTENRVLPSSYKYTIPPVYMVYNRPDYLRESIDSLRNSDFPREKVPIIISHDGHIEEMTKYVDSIKKEFRVIQLFHPHACSEHPSTFPGDDPKLNENYQGDTYGHPRTARVTCCKHHFTWLMNEVFSLDQLKDADGFLFLEEDYVVSETIYGVIQIGMDYIDTHHEENKFFGLTFDASEGFSMNPPSGESWIEKRFVTGPMAFRRDMFQKIKAHSKSYCTFDDYNWDWSLVHLMSLDYLPYEVLVPGQMQVAHIGLEGGLHAQNMSKQKTDRMRNRGDLKPFHNPVDRLVKFQNNLKIHQKGFGGWGHPADHAHCQKLFNDKRTWKDILGMPTQ